MTADVQKVKLHVHRMRCAMDTGFCRNETLLLHLSTRVQGPTFRSMHVNRQRTTTKIPDEQKITKLPAVGFSTNSTYRM